VVELHRARKERPKQGKDNQANGAQTHNILYEHMPPGHEVIDDRKDNRHQKQDVEPYLVGIYVKIDPRIRGFPEERSSNKSTAEEHQGKYKKQCEEQIHVPLRIVAVHADIDAHGEQQELESNTNERLEADLPVRKQKAQSQRSENDEKSGKIF
jgi:hypothetical protein